MDLYNLLDARLMIRNKNLYLFHDAPFAYACQQIVYTGDVPAELVDDWDIPDPFVWSIEYGFPQRPFDCWIVLVRIK